MAVMPVNRRVDEAPVTAAGLDPGGRVIVSVYSSGAIGRLVPQDVAGLAGYLRDHTQPS